MIKAIIFDLDGTLLDTSHDIHKVINASLNKFGLDQISYTDTLKFIGDGAKKLVERAVGERTDMLNNVYSDYSERFANCDNKLTCLYPEEVETLNKFNEAGIHLAIVTNKPQRATEHVYADFLSNFNFNIVLGQTEYYPLKPNPASTFAILEKLGVKAGECLFVGDGETDVKTAKAAGLKCVSVLWGFRTEEQLLKAGADSFAEKFSDLERYVFYKFL